MRPPSPSSEQYRHEVQSRVQNLVSGHRPRHPEHSSQSTRRLILEAIVEEVKIYRLRKEEKVRKAREGSVQRHIMLSRSRERDNHRRTRRSSSRGRRYEQPPDRQRSRSHERDHRDRRGRQRKRQEADNPVSGTTNRSNPDSRFHMAGGAGPSGITTPRSSTPPSRSSHSNTSPKPQERGRSNHKQRFDSRGKPLVRGKRGWRDPSVGPPPKYKFKFGPTMGLGTHVKEKFQWGKESYKLEQKKKERRARGTLEERRGERKKKREEEKQRGDGKDKGEKKKDRNEMWSREPKERHDQDEPCSQRSVRSPARCEHTPDSYHRSQRESPERHSSSLDPHRSPRRSPNTEEKARAGAEARSRGERLARREARSRDASASDIEEPLAQVHFNSASSGGPRRNSTSLERGQRAPSNTGQQTPPYPAYDETPRSHEVEDRERVQARREQGIELRVDSSGVHLSSNGSSDDFPGTADRERNVSQMTTYTHWWSDDSGTPPSETTTQSNNNEEGDGRFFSESFIHELRSRTGSLESPHGHGFTGEDEGASDTERPPSLAKSTTSAHSNREREPVVLTPAGPPSRGSVDGADIFGNLAAHMEKLGRDKG